MTKRKSNPGDKIVRAFGHGPVLLKKPAVAIHWLLSARAAQITLVILALTVPTLVTGAADALLEKLYPPIVHEELFGLMKKTYKDPRLKRGREIARYGLYTGSGCLILMLLLLHIPRAVKEADEKARIHERDADLLLDRDPSKSVFLYQSALKLSVDAGHTVTLMEKLRSFDTKLLAGKPLALPETDRPKSSIDVSNTVLLTSGDRGQKQNDPDSNDNLGHVGTGNRYRISGTLGRGAMGITHRAHDTVLEREVALKELLPDLADDPELSSRFRQEAKVLAQLTHPCIVQVYDFIEDEGRIWIVMELVRGGELADLLRERGFLSVPEVARLGTLMAEAMAYAHARSIVHRDFKPSNVMLSAGGEPKITDFGLAKFALSSQHTQAGTVAGSPYYMSPEQAEGRKADWRSDIYSNGVVLYQMLTGKVPFDGDNIASVLAQHVGREPVPPGRILREIPEEMDEIILIMLAKNPDDRVQDMDSVAKILKKYTGDPGL